MALIDTLALTPEQRAAAVERERDVAVSAGAGSGKTGTLVSRYLALLDDGLLPRQVVAVTFTEKAAREMRNRVRASVHAWLAEACPLEARLRWAEIEADIDAARIGTIHSLCAAILRAHPAEAGVDPRFEVLDDTQAGLLQRQAVEAALAWAVREAETAALFASFTTETLANVLDRLLKSRLDATAAMALDVARQWPAVLGSELRAFLIAGDVAGAIAELRGLQADKRLAADAGPTLEPQVLGLLAEWQSVERALADGRVFEAAAALFIVRRVHCSLKAGKATSRAKEAIRALRGRYDAMVDPWLRGSASTHEAPDPRVDAQMIALATALRRAFERGLAEYQGAKDLRHALDFDDLEAGAARLLELPEVRSRWQAQVLAVLVDEFQDTNERQRRIVEALAGVPEGQSGRLFVVGDAKQSIYRFRGADVAVFLSLDRDLRDRGGLPLRLDLTFRAHQGLVAGLNELLRAAWAAAGGAGQVPFSPLSANRTDPRTGIEAPYIEFLCTVEPGAEHGRQASAVLLAQRLQELYAAGAIRWDDVALLFRASPAFADYEDALTAAGIPFVTVAGRGFYERPEVRDVLNLLRALADPWNDLALAGLLRSPGFGVSDAALYALRWPPDGSGPLSYRQALAGGLAGLSEGDRAAAARAREALARLTGWVDRVPVAELLKAVLDETLYPAVLAAASGGTRLKRNLDKLLADAHSSGLIRVGEFLEYLEQVTEAGAREGEAPSEAAGAVRLMTVHKAKGLEFPVVVLADAARKGAGGGEKVLLSARAGVVPRADRLATAPLIYRWASADDDGRSLAEEMRILYVAATRAKEKLIICGHRPKSAGNTWLNLLAGAAGVSLDQAAATPGAWQCEVLKESGQQVGVLAGPATADSSALSALGDGQLHRPTELDSLTPLFRPLAIEQAAEPDHSVVEASAVPDRSQPTRWAGRLAPHGHGSVLGSIVHAALRQWWFPGHAGLDRLLLTALCEMGHADLATAEAYSSEAKRLLAQFQADPRWPAIDAAERRHEVPFYTAERGRIQIGYIDLLYRGPDGDWHLVEFKTDSVANEGQLQELAMGKYRRQMNDDQQAVNRLLGSPAVAELCFLDYAGAIRWWPLD